MSETKDYKPRFTFEITEEQKARADKLLGAYGVRKAVMPIILDDLLDLVEAHGQVIVGAIIGKHVSSSSTLPSMIEGKKQGKFYNEPK